MSKRNNFIWKVIQVICWIIFIGYCIQAGTLIFNYIFSLFKPIATHNLHLGLDLSQLYTDNKFIYSSIFLIIITISLFKAFIFFHILKLFKALNIANPFNESVSNIISKITYYTFAIGIIGIITQKIFKSLIDTGFNIGLVERYTNDGSAFLVMSTVLFVIALVFQKGIELQNENDLTI